MGTIITAVENYYFARYPQDRRHVSSLLNWFDVTRAGRLRQDPMSPSVYHLKPASSDVARFLGIDDNREVLYLFSPNQVLEYRELSAAEDARQADRGRLDPHLVIIGSNDPRAGERVQRFLSQDPERTPIVGLSAGELEGIESSDDLYRVFRERHFSRDYFALEAPLTDETMFFGRATLVSELAARAGDGQNSGLFGLRRIGKTSILYAVARQCKADAIGYAYYRDLSPAYHLRWWQVLELIVTELADQLQIAKGVRRKLRATSSGYEEAKAAIDFGADIELLCARVPHGRLVLLLDEIEYVTFDLSPAEHWQDDFLSMWATLRSVHQNSRGKFSFIVAGVNPYATERHRIGNHDNPLFSTTGTFFVSPLTREHTAQMIRSLGRMMGISVDRPLIDSMYASFGGHPFLTRRACSHLSKSLPDRPAVMTGGLWESHRVDVGQALGPIATQILTVLESWYPTEYELLQALAQGDTNTFSDFARSSAEFCSHVVGYGLVADPLTAPSFTIGLVADVLRRMAVEAGSEDERSGVPDDAPQPEDDDSYWDSILGEISRRRNRLERDLRRRAKMTLEMKHGRGARDVVLAVLTSKRQKDLASLSYRELWDELYWPELGKIIEAHWTLFQNWAQMDASLFSQRMTTINQGRADAHARTIDTENLAFLRVCFQSMERVCDL